MSNDKGSIADDERIQRSVRLRLIQLALRQEIKNGFDPLTLVRLESEGISIGALSSMDSPELRAAIKAAGDPNQPERLPGPLLFVLTGTVGEVVELAVLLFSPSKQIRDATTDLLSSPKGSSVWSESTRATLPALRSSASADDAKEWFAAAIAFVESSRTDSKGCVAGLRQSLSMGYYEGVNDYCRRLLRPSLRMVRQADIPFLRGQEAIEGLVRGMSEWVKAPTLAEALDLYVGKCGYVPLASPYSAVDLARAWCEQHQGASTSWKELEEWSRGYGTTLAKFYAVSVAIGLRQCRPLDSADFWRDVGWALAGVRPAQEADQMGDDWAIRSALSKHYVRVVEGLLPGQSGEVVARIAWWFAEQLLQGWQAERAHGLKVLPKIVEREARISSSRWGSARSPVLRSPLRYVTLYRSSLWPASMSAQLLQSDLRLEAPAEVRERVVRFVCDYSVLGSLKEPGVPCAQTQAFQVGPNDELSAALAGLLEPSNQAVLDVVNFRFELRQPAALKARLMQLSKLPTDEQKATAVHIHEAVSCSSDFDDAFAEWLSRGEEPVEALVVCPVEVSKLLMEAALEFQQQSPHDWMTRVPHLAAAAVERCDDQDRALHLCEYVFSASVNGCVGEALRRVGQSRWRTEFLGTLPTGRDNLRFIAECSEPWLQARIRAISSAISSLVGPRQVSVTETVDGEDL